MLRPATSTTPASGWSSPPRICSSVVLPEPEAPMTASRSPRATCSSTPVSTSSVVVPSRKLRNTPRAVRTAPLPSVMTQCLGRLRTGGAPGGIQRRQRTQRKRHAADAQHIARLRIRRQIAHEVNLGIEKVCAQYTLEPVHQRLKIGGQDQSQRRPGTGAGHADERSLDRERSQDIVRPGAERAQNRYVGALFLH